MNSVPPLAPELARVSAMPATMLEIVQHEAEGYRARGNEIGDFLARQMERLARLIVFTSATTPAEFEDRIEILDRGLRDQILDRELSVRSVSPC
jgi:hypothetical protein